MNVIIAQLCSRDHTHIHMHIILYLSLVYHAVFGIQTGHGIKHNHSILFTYEALMNLNSTMEIIVIAVIDKFDVEQLKELFEGGEICDKQP